MEEFKDFSSEDFKKFAAEFDPELLKALGNPAELKNEIQRAGKAWFGMEEIKNHAELLNWAIRTRFEALSTIGALAATLLVIATFNDKLIVLDNFVRLILTILILLIPGSLWCLFYETGKAAQDAFNKIYSVSEKAFGADAAAKVKAAKKPSFRGALPGIMYCLLSLAAFSIIYLIWRNQF